MTPKNETAVLVDELAPPLVRYLSTKVRNSEDANDLAQEAFLRMHKFQQSSQLENARAFLYRTANNLVIDQMRRAQVHDRYLHSTSCQDWDDETDECAPSAERTASAEQELAHIYQLIEQLPPKIRRAFVLHRNSDRSYQQIADEMGVSTSMVEKYIVKALKILRENVN
jgi:RNA polymerase sigma factor (sigma-70 family)